MQSEELFTGHGWRVTMDSAPLSDGRVKKAARVHRCDSVHIIAFKNQEKILLLRQFRPFYGDYLWMLPSGKVDKETDPDTGAERELREETGYRSLSMKKYCTTRHSESLDSANHIYIAHDLEPAPLPQDDDELIEVHEVSVDEAIARVLGSPHVHTVSAYALLRYARDHTQ